MSNKCRVKILLAIASESERCQLAEFLLVRSYQVYMAADGIEVIETARREQPDFVLMDVYLPLCDGYAAAQRIRSIPSLTQTELIFIASAAEPADRVTGLRLGAVDFLVKPFDFEEVALRLEMHVSRLQSSRLLQSLALAENIAIRNEGSGQRLLLVAVACMQKRMRERVTLEELAQDLGVSSKRLNTLFRQQYEMTAGSYWRKLRMEQAAQLLLDTLLDISEIAGEVGFATPASFATAFREFHSVTPSEYRKSANGLRSAE